MSIYLRLRTVLTGSGRVAPRGDFEVSEGSDQLGLVPGTKSKIEDGSATGTFVTLGTAGEAQKPRIRARNDGVCVIRKQTLYVRMHVRFEIEMSFVLVLSCAGRRATGFSQPGGVRRDEVGIALSGLLSTVL